MPIIHRFTRLLTADLNAVLDRIEEPEVLLRQAVRDMQAELDHIDVTLRECDQQREQAAARADEARRALARLDDELDVCFAAGEESLARSLVRRKLEQERRQQAAEATATAAAGRRAELETAAREGRERLAAMREKLELASAPTAAAPEIAAAVGSDEVEAAFLREKQRRTRS